MLVDSQRTLAALGGGNDKGFESSLLVVGRS
jgi:hypothetical protein